jgi:hypothetical protein
MMRAGKLLKKSAERRRTLLPKPEENLFDQIPKLDGPPNLR